MRRQSEQHPASSPEQPRPDDAIAFLEAILGLAQQTGEAAPRVAALNNLPPAHRSAGRLGRAREHLKRAVSIFADVAGDAEPQPAIWKLVEW